MSSNRRRKTVENTGLAVGKETDREYAEDDPMIKNTATSSRVVPMMEDDQHGWCTPYRYYYGVGHKKFILFN